MAQITEKKVAMSLVGLDGNAFSLMGAFSREARKQGWTKEEIDAVMNECMSGDYNHLLSTLMDYTDDQNCNTPDEEDDYYNFERNENE